MSKRTCSLPAVECVVTRSNWWRATLSGLTDTWRQATCVQAWDTCAEKREREDGRSFISHSVTHSLSVHEVKSEMTYSVIILYTSMEYHLVFVYFLPHVSVCIQSCRNGKGSCRDNEVQCVPCERDQQDQDKAGEDYRK